MINKEARRKRDVKRDFRGILAIKSLHSLPRHLTFKRGFHNLSFLLELGVIASFLKWLRLFYFIGYICVQL